MADFSDLVRADAVQSGLSAATKKAALAGIAALAQPVTGIDARTIAAALAAREKLGSTGFGGGVAVPHCRLAGLEQVTAVVARLAQPVDFGAVDGVPVDLLVGLFSPPAAGAAHLKALARVSRQLRDQAFVAKLRGAASPDALYALFTEDEARDAA